MRNLCENYAQSLHFLKGTYEEDLSREIVLEVGIILWILDIPDIKLEKKGEADESPYLFAVKSRYENEHTFPDKFPRNYNKCSRVKASDSQNMEGPSWGPSLWIFYGFKKCWTRLIDKLFADVW